MARAFTAIPIYILHKSYGKVYMVMECVASSFLNRETTHPTTRPSHPSVRGSIADIWGNHASQKCDVIALMILLRMLWMRTFYACLYSSICIRMCTPFKGSFNRIQSFPKVKLIYYKNRTTNNVDGKFLLDGMDIKLFSLSLGKNLFFLPTWKT